MFQQTAACYATGRILNAARAGDSMDDLVEQNFREFWRSWRSPSNKLQRPAALASLSGRAGIWRRRAWRHLPGLPAWQWRRSLPAALAKRRSCIAVRVPVRATRRDALR